MLAPAMVLQGTTAEPDVVTPGASLRCSAFSEVRRCSQVQPDYDRWEHPEIAVDLSWSDCCQADTEA